ncbi:calumenin-B-like [Dendronephthya gigantea]|uniref:calumenin-B-like n=1 Tax=Dendronephthya gigantea TaxID=151771 RepID=UPI00106B5FC6|nr:calumenin-B-like [Dendronephthya gigantea]
MIIPILGTTRGQCWSFLIFILHYSLALRRSTSEDSAVHQTKEDSVQNIEKFIKNKIDLDQDGLVTQQEMVEKMEKTFLRQRQNEVGELIHKYDINMDKKISWKEFLSTSYPDEALRNLEDLDYDKRKFNMADTDGDGLLNSKEFASFYFPGAGNEDMVEMVVDEWLKKVDLNSDGFVTTNEFLAYQSAGNPDINDQRKLKEHFNNEYDINKDGRLDKEELRKWLAPNRANAMRETRRILKLADNDGDGNLDMKEISDSDHSLHSWLHDIYKDEL